MLGFRIFVEFENMFSGYIKVYGLHNLRNSELVVPNLMFGIKSIRHYVVNANILSKEQAKANSVVNKKVIGEQSIQS